MILHLAASLPGRTCGRPGPTHCRLHVTGCFAETSGQGGGVFRGIGLPAPPALVGGSLPGRSPRRRRPWIGGTAGRDSAVTRCWRFPQATRSAVWKNLRSLVVVRSCRTEDGKDHWETRKQITSHASEAKPQAKAIRRHWGIENTQQPSPTLLDKVAMAPGRSSRPNRRASAVVSFSFPGRASAGAARASPPWLKRPEQLCSANIEFHRLTPRASILAWGIRSDTRRSWSAGTGRFPTPPATP